MRRFKFHYCVNLGKRPDPAMCNRDTGDIYINEKVFFKLSHPTRVFVLLHEIGHIQLQSKNEFKVDEFAFKYFIQGGYKLTDAVQALTDVLPGHTLEQRKRAILQLQRAKGIDNAK